VLLVFLDSVLTSQDQQTQRSVIDELLEDLTSIVCGLLRWAKLSENKDTKGLSVEDSALLLDVHAKALSAVELFVSTKGTKSSFREAVSPDNLSIEYVVAFIRYFSQCSFDANVYRSMQIRGASISDDKRGHFAAQSCSHNQEFGIHGSTLTEGSI
jgi:hypothetical protein